MNVLTDACSIINLTNVGALEAVLSLEQCRLAVPPIVLSECNVAAAAQIVAAEAEGRLDFIDDDEVPADRYLELLVEHNLGEGETECLTVAELDEYHICCDDRRARNVATVKFGEGRVIGSLRLLRWCVEETVLSCAAAFAFFEQMRGQGGFLPDVEHEFFCRGI